MGLFSDVFTGKEAETFSTTSPEQQNLMKKTAGYGEDLMGYSGDYLAQVMKDINDMNSVFGKAQTALLNELDPTAIMDRWKSLVADPMMNAWERTGASAAREGYNLPGAYYSASRGKGVQREANQFLSENVMPSLFASMENWAARLPSTAVNAAMLKGNVIGQAMNPALGVYGTSAGLSTAQTQETMAYQPPDYLGLAGQLGGAYMMGSMLKPAAA